MCLGISQHFKGELACGFQSPVSTTLSSSSNSSTALHLSPEPPASCCHPINVSGANQTELVSQGCTLSVTRTSQIPPGLRHCQFFQTFVLCFFFLLALLLFGREMTLTQAFAPCEEPKALCCFHLLSPSQVGRKPFSWQTGRLDPTQSTENGMLPQTTTKLSKLFNCCLTGFSKNAIVLSI